MVVVHVSARFHLMIMASLSYLSKKKVRSTATRRKGGNNKTYSHLRKGSYKANAHCWSFPNASSVG